jgi:choline dehydrogenase-like flavoprotein
MASSMSQGNYPDIYINHVGVGVHKTLGLEQDQIFGFIPGTMQSFLAPYEGKDAFFASVNLGPTKSVGNIRLQSSDPAEYPLIDPKYLTHPYDVKLMIEGINILFFVSK